MLHKFWCHWQIWEWQKGTIQQVTIKILPFSASEDLE